MILIFLLQSSPDYSSSENVQEIHIILLAKAEII